MHVTIPYITARASCVVAIGARLELLEVAEAIAVRRDLESRDAGTP